MVEFLRRMVNESRDIWLRLETGQRLSIIFFAALTIAVVVTLMVWAASPNYIPLMTNLTAENLNEAVAAMRQAGIEPRTRGNTIEVPGKNYESARMALAGAGLQPTADSGVGAIDRLGFGTTPAELDIARIRDLKGGFEQQIKEMFGARRVRVNLTMPSPTFFARQLGEEFPRASVSINIPPARIMPSRAELNSVRNLLTAVHPRMKRDDVTVVVNGETVFESASAIGPDVALNQNELAYRRGLERDYENKIDKVLSPMWPDHRATVSLDINFDKVTERDLQLEGDPLELKVKTEDRTLITTVGPPSGVSGMTANVAGLAAGRQTRTDDTTNISETESTIAHKTTTTTRAPSIQRISVAVLIPDIPAEPAEGVEEEAAPATGEQMRQAEDEIRTLVASAVGLDLDETTGNQISVMRAAFLPSGVGVPMVAPPAGPRIEWVRQIGYPALVVLLIIGAFFALRYILMSLMTTVAEAPEVALPEVEVSEEERLRRRINEELARMSRDHPDNLAEVLKAWLTED